jgi:uncharacterized membrane protein YccC
VSEAEARGWAQDEFGFVLERLRHRLDAKLAQRRAALDRARAAPIAPDHAIAPDAVPAAFDLLCKLPRAILDAVSGDAARVTQAQDELTAIERRLGAAGADVAPRLGAFPARLAGLRREFEVARQPRDNKPGHDESSHDKPGHETPSHDKPGDGRA